MLILPALRSRSLLAVLDRDDSAALDSNVLWVKFDDREAAAVEGRNGLRCCCTDDDLYDDEESSKPGGGGLG